ncbi:UNVERIFIED_ORG: hypothetical protein GGI66_006479 [Rhizobium esperanzae]
MEKPVTPAPVTFVSWRIQTLTCLAFGFLAASASAAWMDPQLKHHDLASQEQTSWK